MAQNGKTPVAILQELTMQKGLGLPEYQLVFQITGTHNTRFDYMVKVAGIQACGTGPSKQISKHQAAHNALIQLEEMGIYLPSAENPVGSYKKPRLNESSPFVPAPNCIDKLNNMVLENKLPFAEFVEISCVGPPHNREFTFDCKVASVTTTATASSKKLAKQIAAKNMIEKIEELLPQLTLQQPLVVEMEDQTAAAIIKHRELDEFPMPDRNLNIDELDQTLAKLMRSKNLTYKDFEENLKIPTEESLNRILDRLEVGNCFAEIQKTPTVVSFSLKINTPFTVWATGEDFEEAKRKALVESFQIMDQMMKLEI